MASQKSHFLQVAVNASWQPDTKTRRYDRALLATMIETRPFLRAWRKKVGWTQAKLANELGTDHTTISRYEKGKVRVDDATFSRIAAAYGITPAELSASPDDAERAREMHRIMSAIRELDDVSLRALADMAERLPRRPKP
jgi:transcriptional regulator with XRE-family HTH domain